MPFRSQAQRKKLWATNPELARKFERETPKDARLPERVNERSARKEALRRKARRA